MTALAAETTDQTMKLSDLKTELTSAKTGDTISLDGNVTITEADLIGLSKNGSVITVPAGVTLNGNSYTITASGWTEAEKNFYHILSVENASKGTTTTIENLTIVGNANTKSGIHAYNCEGTVNLTGVTIQNCGNAAVQVNGSKVIATGLTTSGNAWGGVNVDQGTSVTTAASFTLDATSSIAEPVKVWTELTSQENITVPGSWVQVRGSSNNAYAPENTLTKNVIHNETKDIYYQSLELAVKEANASDQLNVYPGNYNIQQDDSTIVEGQTGWYLPINETISIQGVDNNGTLITDATKTQANIYSTDYSANGAWATQNLITVLADNVTISGLTIMNKVAANKAIEVTSDANDFSLNELQICTYFRRAA